MPQLSKEVMDEIAHQEVIRAKIQHYKHALYALMYNCKPDLAAMNVTTSLKGAILSEEVIPNPLAVMLIEQLLAFHRLEMQQSIARTNKMRGI